MTRSIINLISQSTTAIAGVAGQTHRFSELLTQSPAEGSALRVAAGLAEIDCSMRQVNQGINTSVDANNKLSTAAFDTLQRKISYNVIAQERLGRPDALQAVNQGGETITLSSVSLPSFLVFLS